MRVLGRPSRTRREDFQAMLRTEDMRRRNREIAGRRSQFQPVAYEVTAVF